MQPQVIICKDRAEWLEARKDGLGASDAAALLGLSPWKTNVQLWEEKCGLVIPEDIGDKPYVRYGNDAEPLLRSFFALDHPEYRVSFTPYKIIKHQDLPFITCTPDGELEETATGRLGGLEIKTTEILSSTGWTHWKGRIPTEYYAQVCQQMLAAGWQFVELLAQIKYTTAEGEDRKETRHYKIERRMPRTTSPSSGGRRSPSGAAWSSGRNQISSSRLSEQEDNMSMEFVMGNSLETLPKTIDFNFEELKGQLAESLALYTGLVVTEDGIKGAKEDRAKLNKLREALENKRKEVKRECMAPYTDFEAKVKELVGLIDQPIAAIDAQLKEYEEKRRADKRAAILEIYEETVGELRALLPFEKLWQDTWYNTSVTMKKVREAIVAAEDKAASDLEVLATVESEFAEAVKIKYLEHLDLNEALMERSRLQERAKRLREYEAQRTAQAANLAEEQRKAEATRGAEQTPDPAANAAQAGTWEPGGGEAVEEAIYLLRFECQVTKDQAAELSRWLKERNISYRRI